jgi:hypothetical protein
MVVLRVGSGGSAVFCPQCGTNQAEDLKFCTSCGAPLFAVRKALTSRDTEEKFDWSKTWVAEILLSQEEREKREQARKKRMERGEEAAVKRYNEIKAGVITTCVGAGVMIFLHTLFQGIIASGDVAADAAAILRVLWVVGVIPLVVGLGLAFNGLVVSRKQVEIARGALPVKPGPKALASGTKQTDPTLNAADWAEPPEFGVTENTTRELR